MRTTLGRFLRITLPLAGMNFLTQCARAGLAVVGPVLAVEYGFSASELGLLSAVMFAAYGLWQLPVGLLLDLFGPRRVQTGMALTAACGFVLFALADSLGGFIAARLVTGIGVAAGLTGMMKGNSQWFARHQMAAVTGWGLLIGGLGGMAATMPVEALLPRIGWRGVFLVFASIAVAVSAWNALSLRAPPGAVTPRKSLREEIGSIVTILTDRGFWRLTPMVCLLSVMTFTYQSLWAGPWLRDVAGFDAGLRARTLLFYALGMMIGSAAWGMVASRLTARGRSQMVVPWIGTILLILAQIGLILAPRGVWTVTLVWTVFAALASSGPTGYAAIAATFPVALMGRVATAINAVMLATVFGLQASIGWILDLWPRAPGGGWAAEGYGWAIGVSLAMQIAAAAWALRPQRLREGDPVRQGGAV
jgi:sugar phosphate permease